MSQPLDNILKAITDHAAPRTETRRLPNWFTLVYEEDYRVDRCGASDIDPAATTKDRDGVEGVPKKKSDVNGKTK